MLLGGLTLRGGDGPGPLAMVHASGTTAEAATTVCPMDGLKANDLDLLRG